MLAVEVLALLASLAQSFLLGYLFVRLCRPELGGGRQWFGLRIALAFGCGVGFSSAVYLVLYRFATPFTGWCFAVEFVVAGLLAWRLFREPTTVGPSSPETSSRWLPALALFLVANSLVRFVTQSLQQPLGATDAFTMWNVRARYLFWATDDWATAFDRSFNTPDYPLLLPAFVARAWKAMGIDGALAPSAVALLFTLATVLCLFATLRALRGRNQASLGVIGLLSAPAFIFHAATQYADIVMAYYMCAAVGLASVSRSLFPDGTRLLSLVGLLAGLAAWTKNEGVLFALTLAVAIAVVAWKGGGLTRARAELQPYLLGLAAPCIALVYFKMFVAPASEFVSEQVGWGPMLEQLMEIDRHLYLLQTAAYLFFYFNMWPSILPAIVILGLSVGLRVRPGQGAGVAYPALVLIQMCLGYYTICLIGPHHFEPYVEYSAFRLLVQLWPLIMLLAFMVIKPFSPSRKADS